MLSNTATATILGLADISVAAAGFDKAEGASLEFTISLNRAAASEISVDYATSDGTATAGEDCTGTSGTLTFAIGDESKTVGVPMLDYEHDQGEETFRLVLPNMQGNAWLADAEATGVRSRN